MYQEAVEIAGDGEDSYYDEEEEEEPAHEAQDNELPLETDDGAEANSR